MTGLAAIIFAIVDPQKALSPDQNSNATQGEVELNDSSHSDSVVYIFRSVDFYPSFFRLGLILVLAFVVCLLFWRLFYAGDLQERSGIDKECAPLRKNYGRPDF